jgi:hypothetical protein
MPKNLPRNHFHDKSFTLSIRHLAEKIPSKNRILFCEIIGHPNPFFVLKLKPRKTLNNPRLLRWDTHSTPNYTEE